MSERSFDVIVIGGGPAGYHAAIRAAQLGLDVACVDARIGAGGKAALGGACLNVGCIPSKALLDSSRQFWNLTRHFGAHGITARGAAIDIGAMLGRKDRIVEQLTGGVARLFKANRITSFIGRGRVFADRRVEITAPDGNRQIVAGTNVIIATGAVPIELPFARFDGRHIVDSTGALAFAAVPRRLGVIGAGTIGLELGSVWHRLGSEVTIIETLPDFLAAADADIARAALRELTRQGLRIELGAQLSRVDIRGDEVHLVYGNKDGAQRLVVDKLLVAVGRRADTGGAFGNDVDVQIDERGRIVVDEYCWTGVEGIWAIGDCVRGPMLAHKAFEEGVAVAEIIAGLPAGRMNMETIPWVIYTEPEIAWVGKTQAQCEADDIPYKTGSFPFAAAGRAIAMNEPAGLVKMIAHMETDRILGVHLIGANVSELVAECVMAMEFAGTSADVARIVHAHPTLSEAVREAALALGGRAIHKVN